jgi:hypothetical protein
MLRLWYFVVATPSAATTKHFPPHYRSLCSLVFQMSIKYFYAEFILDIEALYRDDIFLKDVIS